MNTKGIAIGIAVVIAFGAFFVYGQQTGMLTNDAFTPSQEQNVSFETYLNSAYGIAFQYPSNLYLSARESGTPERPQLGIVLVEDTETNREYIAGTAATVGEGPTAITVDVYPNPENLTAKDWAAKETTWSVANAEAVPVNVNGAEGVVYTWSGLYEGRTVILTKESKAYVFSVTWLTPEDQLLKDFDMVLTSFTATAPAAQ